MPASRPMSYFLVGPGHPRALWRPPMHPAGRRAWKQCLAGVAATLALATSLGLLVVAGSGPSPAEATARLEQLAAKMARTQVVHPATAQEIGRLVRLRPYDCTQIACNGEVAARNAAARARLVTLLAEKTPGAEIVTAGAH